MNSSKETALGKQQLFDKTAVVIAAYNAEPELQETIRSLREAGVQNITVVDDGSVDQTLVAAGGANKVLHCLPNLGKGAAMQVGIEANSDVPYLLFVDADTGSSAAKSVALLEPVWDNECDMAIAVLPGAGKRGGFGFIKRFAAWGIRRASGFEARAPLSGQRALRSSAISDIVFEKRFGVEIALTIDVVRRGFRVREIPLDMTHRHRGRSVAGFAHRGMQGVQIAASLLTRLTTQTQRVAALLACTAIALFAIFGIASRDPLGHARWRTIDARSTNVFAIPGLTWDEVDTAQNKVQLQSGIWANVVTQRNPTKPEDQVVKPGTNVAFSTDLDEVLSRIDANSAFVIIGVETPQDSVSEDKQSEQVLVASRTRPMFVSGQALHLVPNERNANGAVMLSSDTRRATFIPARNAVEIIEGGQFPYVNTKGNAEQVTSLRAHDLERGLHYRNQNIGLFGALIVLSVVALLVEYLRRASRLTKATDTENTNKSSKLGTAIVLATAAFPAASLLATGAMFVLHLPSSVSIPMHVLLTALLAVLCAKLSRNAWFAFRKIAGFFIALVTLDLLTGSHLQFGGTLGSDPAYGRYYGLGNPVAVLLMIATITLGTSWVAGAIRKYEARWCAACLFVIAGTAASLGGLGSDVGSLLSYSFVGIGVALWLVVASNSSRRFRNLVVVVALVVAAVAGLVAFDATRAPEAQSHLGQFVNQVLDSDSRKEHGPIETIVRKAKRNVFENLFPLGPIALALTAGLFVALLRTSFAARLIAAGSVARAGTLIAMGGAVAMYVFNDSGVVVLALAMVFLIPFVMFCGTLGTQTVEVIEK